MPVRSIKLKLVVPRSEAGRELRRALWFTHEEVNAATRYYEQWLLLLRGRSYETPEGVVSAEDVHADLIRAVRAAQQANCKRAGEAPQAVGSDKEVADALFRLFDLIAPDETGKASAQTANGFLSPLVDPESIGFGTVTAKLERPRPNWLSRADDDPALLTDAKEWLASDDAASWRGDTGSPATWLRAARAGKPDWPSLFRKKLEELERARAEGPEAAVAKLRALRLLPLLPAYFPPKMSQARAAVTPWDRLALRLAVSHLLSWQAWVRRAAQQHAARAKTLEEYRSRVVTPEIEPRLLTVREYEQHRSAALSGTGLGPAEYRLQPRQLRGWPELRKVWLKADRTKPEALLEISTDHQTKLRGRFGDPEVFRWLSEPSQQGLWADQDVPTIAATLNAMQALLERSRETATMTLPDAQRHPRAVEWAAEGDTNLRPYRLIDVGDGKLVAELSLLQRDEQGRLDEFRSSFPLAASGQLRNARLGHRGKKAELTYQNDTGQELTGVIGSADLLFDRSQLGHRDSAALASGDVGPVWLKLAVDVDQQLPEGWGTDHARFVHHFASAAGAATRHEAALRTGARVLSVDLGIRTLAACSVFTLQDRPPPGASRQTCSAFPVPLDGKTLWAVHERSFPLKLPDESPDRDGGTWRTVRRAELQRLRQALAFYRRALRLADLELADRLEALQGMEALLSESEHFPPQDHLLAALRQVQAAPGPVWNDALTGALRAFRSEMGPIVRRWRRESRERQSFTYLGKSMWAVEYLTDTRRLLMSWSLLGRKSGEVRRLDRAGRGTFASRLLEHLNAAKEDRLKTGADLIVQAAMGFARGKAGRWEHRFSPCDVVLFEDLSRYRMRTDRPRRENSQLMRWAHRALPAEVKMQGELYGLEVVDTGAAFSSRYHARMMTPGVRCQPLSKADLGDAYLVAELLESGIELERCRPGDLVPRAGGKMFACVDAGGGLVTLDADINAAQNLQRRFWTRHATAFRLPCVRWTVEGAEVWVPRKMGKRLLGALGGTGVLRPTGHEMGSCRWEGVRKSAVRKMIGADEEVRPEDEEAEELAGIAEAAEEATGQVEVFFRDPSGNVLPKDLWYPAATFWSIVKAKTAGGLKQRLGVRIDAV